MHGHMNVKKGNEGMKLIQMALVRNQWLALDNKDVNLWGP
jgi:hypothetical protein